MFGTGRTEEEIDCDDGQTGREGEESCGGRPPMDGTDEMSEGGRREVGKTYSNLVRPGTLVLVRPNTGAGATLAANLTTDLMILVSD